jgi:hypothetical protein
MGTGPAITEDQRAVFAARGFVVLRDALDAGALAREADAALARGFAETAPVNTSAEAGISFRYLPVMVDATPLSLELIRRLRGPAEMLIGGPVLPGRAKVVEYHGGSGWHRDSALPLTSIGFAAYLEPLSAAAGALRVVPGSHRDGTPVPAGAPEGQLAVATEPGDVIVFDEHLLHASEGGRVRRQWRTDFVARPTTDGEREVVREYFAGIFTPGWDGGYDVSAFPTYGPHWRATCDPADDALLEALGAYAGATAEEDAARRARPMLG